MLDFLLLLIEDTLILSHCISGKRSIDFNSYLLLRATSKGRECERETTTEVFLSVIITEIFSRKLTNQKPSIVEVIT